MQERRRVIYGDDLIKDLKIDFSFYRALVEHELRAKQIRLRQKAAEMLSQPARLVKLMTDSVSTFLCARQACSDLEQQRGEMEEEGNSGFARRCDWHPNAGC